MDLIDPTRIVNDLVSMLIAKAFRRRNFFLFPMLFDKENISFDFKVLILLQYEYKTGFHLFISVFLAFFY